MPNFYSYTASVRYTGSKSIFGSKNSMHYRQVARNKNRLIIAGNNNEIMRQKIVEYSAP